jgi:hypothetical protein
MKKQFHILIFFLLVISGHSSAQITFQKTYGGPANDLAYSGGQTNDGGYIIAGGTFSFGSGGYNFYLIKLNAVGDTIWTKSIGDAAYFETATTVEQTSDNGYILCGSRGTNPHDIYIVKTNSTGTVQWARLITNGTFIFTGKAAQQTYDGGYMVMGYVYYGTANGDICLIKLDANGSTTWTKYISESATVHEFAAFALQTSDSGFIIFGRNSNIESLLIKTNSSGTVLWTKKYTGLGECYFVQETTDSGLVLLGTADGSNPNDIYLVKTNSAGDTLWTKTYGGSGFDDAATIKQTADGGFIISGSTRSFGAGLSDAYLIKTDAAGNLMWSKAYGGPDYDWAYFAEQTNDGGYIVMGQVTSYGSGASDCYVLKTDSNGNIGCNEIDAATVVGVPAFQVSNVTLLATTGPTVSTPPYTTLSGATVTTPCLITGIHEVAHSNSIQIHPNPISNLTTISFSLSQSGKVLLKIFNLNGRLVSTIADKIFEAGENLLTWKADEVNAGIYFLQFQSAENVKTEKLIVTK